jgi:hypothetical protein
LNFVERVGLTDRSEDWAAKRAARERVLPFLSQEQHNEYINLIEKLIREGYEVLKQAGWSRASLVGAYPHLIKADKVKLDELGKKAHGAELGMWTRWLEAEKAAQTKPVVRDEVA